MHKLDFPHVQDDLNPYILRMLKCTFSLDAAHVWYKVWYKVTVTQYLG